jgi:hypothetical protein
MLRAKETVKGVLGTRGLVLVAILWCIVVMGHGG